MSCLGKSSRGRGVRFERNASRIIFNPSISSYVVTWTKCNRKEEERILGMKDPEIWIPSVSSIINLFERGCIPQNRIVYAARAIGRALKNGDRENLDTEDAKKAAELVSDLSSMKLDAESQSVSMDIGLSIRSLLDEISAVRFSNLLLDQFDEDKIIPCLTKAAVECFETPGFCEWKNSSMRRRFMFCLDKHNRSEINYTLISLFFDVGSCPILTLSDRRIIRMQTLEETKNHVMSVDYMVKFFKIALSKLREMKKDGISKLSVTMSQQQLSDLVSGSSCCDSTHRY